MTLLSDQGCQFTGHEWRAFLESHNLVANMSHGGKCHDNAVAESFIQLIKRKRIRPDLSNQGPGAQQRPSLHRDVLQPPGAVMALSYVCTGRVRTTSISTAQVCPRKPWRCSQSRSVLAEPCGCAHQALFMAGGQQRCPPEEPQLSRVSRGGQLAPFYDLLSVAVYDSVASGKAVWPDQIQLAWPILGCERFARVKKALLLDAACEMGSADPRRNGSFSR